MSVHRVPQLTRTLVHRVPCRMFSTHLAGAVDLNYTEVPSLQNQAELNAPMIIAHGMLGSHTNWRTIAQAPELSLNRRVFTLDLRNHGESPHTDAMNLKLCAYDVIRMLDKLQIEKAVLLGHSLGGKVMMASALMFPERVEKLIVCDIAPVEYRIIKPEPHLSAGHVMDVMGQIDLKTIESRKQADILMNELGIDDIAIRRFAMQNLRVQRDDTGAHWSYRLNLKVLRESWGELHKFSFDQPSVLQHFPTLFITGGESGYCRKPAHFEAADKYFPGVQIKTIKGAGHWLHASHPAEFLSIAHEFLTQTQSKL